MNQRTNLQKCNRLYNPMWSASENKVIKQHYPSSKRDFILSQLPKRSWDGVKGRASKLNVARIGQPDIRGADLSKLLVDSYAAYYWMGFITADGFFSGTNYLGLALSQKDVDHLRRFVSFVDGDLTRIRKNKLGMCDFKCGDNIVVPMIQEKFCLCQNKTKNPPQVQIKDDEFFLSYFIGLIDGDGWIGRQTGGRKDSVISITLDSSWFDFLSFTEQRIYDIIAISPSPRNKLAKLKTTKSVFNHPKKTYSYTSVSAMIRFSNHLIVEQLKAFALTHNLPILERKWCKIEG